MTDQVQAAAHIQQLADSVEGYAVPMAVVDYAGRADGEGVITEADEPARRYGTRSMSDVRGYDLHVVRMNPAATRKALAAVTF